MIYTDDDDGLAWLENVIVHESIRRQGYGNRLLFHAEQEAKKLGLDALWLFVDGPEWVKEWYERNGYVFHHYEDGMAVMMNKIRK